MFQIVLRATENLGRFEHLTAVLQTELVGTPRSDG
jgi:hypothetical protein